MTGPVTGIRRRRAVAGLRENRTCPRIKTFMGRH